jgi:CheY-like chemotaxis protein
VSRVLVVDDSELTHALVRSVLTRAGHVTVHAESSAEAMQLVPGEPPDAMVIDIAMPGMDGIQLAQLLRSGPYIERSLPVVFYSAYLNETNVRARVAGIQAATFVAKDGNVHELVQALGELIEAHAADKAARPSASTMVQIGRGLVASCVPTDGRTVYELRRGANVVLEAPSMEQLMTRARAAGLA